MAGRVTTQEFYTQILDITRWLATSTRHTAGATLQIMSVQKGSYRSFNLMQPWLGHPQACITCHQLFCWILLGMVVLWAEGVICLGNKRHLLLWISLQLKFTLRASMNKETNKQDRWQIVIIAGSPSSHGSCLLKTPSAHIYKLLAETTQCQHTGMLFALNFSLT